MPKGHFLTLVRKIAEAVRKKAQEIPEFKETGNGCIRICAYPCVMEAENWIVGHSYWEEDGYHCGLSSNFIPEKFKDIVDYEYTFAITPGGSRVIERDWGGKKINIDTYAFSALKIAHCSRAEDKGIGQMSGLDLEEDFLNEENGYGPYKGAISVQIKKMLPELVRKEGELVPEEVWKNNIFYGIYVCVSGASDEEDLECAAVAIDVIKEFHEGEAFTEIVTPNLEKPSLPFDDL
jgi:hypothetical protein